VKVTQAYRFALNPVPSQERALRSHAGAARFAWNWGVELGPGPVQGTVRSRGQMVRRC
jgi:Helix-turn-helix domain